MGCGVQRPVHLGEEAGPHTSFHGSNSITFFFLSRLSYRSHVDALRLGKYRPLTTSTSGDNCILLLNRI